MFKKLKNIIFVVLFGLACVGGGVVYWSKHPVLIKEVGPIYQYNKERDHDDIVSLFELERFWLTVSDYDPLFMLKYMAPYKGVAHKDTLRIWVAREGSAFVGFAACYIEKPGVARILFLATRPEFRGKGYGKKLILRVFSEFKALDVEKVTLVTRTTNVVAQGLYTSVGFVEVARDQGDSGHVYYEYYL